MSDAPTTSSLLKQQTISVTDIDQLVGAYAARPRQGWMRLGGSHKLNVHEAIGLNLEVAAELSKPSCIGGWREAMIRRAILMARPEKA